MLKNNKFLDIIPPGKSSVTPYSGSAKSKKPSFLKKGLFIVSFFLLLGIGLVCHFIFARAAISIWPETEFLGFTEQITIDINAKQINFETKTIPGEYFEEIKKGRQEFPSSEVFEKNEKARGIIKVYNKYSPPKPLTLVKGTRFLSSDSEKYFTSTEKVNVPAGKMENGKVVSQWTEIEVVAMESGESYNIGPTMFSVHGLVGTAYYYSIWGESSSAMTGGTSVKMKRVSQGDLTAAQKTLTERMLKEVKSDLQNKIPPDFISFDDAFFQETVNISSLAPVGAEVDSFTCETEVKASVLSVKKEDLEKFAENFILSRSSVSVSADGLFKERKFLKESLTMNYKVKSFDLSTGKIVLDLEFSGKVYPDIDKSILKQAFGKKTMLEIKTFLESQSQITRSEVKFWPFWIKEAPEETEKIEIDLKL